MSSSATTKTWSTGTFGVGYEDLSEGAQGLLQTIVPSGTSTIYTRALFYIEDVSILEVMTLAADYDDADAPYTPAWSEKSMLRATSSAPKFLHSPRVSSIGPPAVIAASSRRAC